MKRKSFGVRTLIIGVALIAGIIAGTLGFKSATASNTKPAPIYSMNKYSETYGSLGEAISRETEPVLASAYGENGIKGYVRTADLNGPMPKSPQEALAMQNKTLAAGGVRKIPLYAVDGKTVIGVFDVEYGNTHSHPEAVGK